MSSEFTTVEQKIALALHNAVKEGRQADVELLIQGGADATIRNENNQNLFHLAMKNGQYNIANYLAKHYPQLNVIDPYTQYTPLHYAAENMENKEAIQTFFANDLYSNYNINHLDYRKNTPLLLALYNENLEAAKYFIEKCGADVHAINYIGNNALHLAAAQSNNGALIAYLIDNKIDVNSTCREKLTPLHYAITSGNIENIKILIKRGANINSQGNNGDTPLITAINNNSEEIVQILIKSGADVNKKYYTNSTALHNAAFNGSFKLFFMLIDAGADAYAKDDNGKTPFDIAKEYVIQRPEKIRDYNEILNFYGEHKTFPIKATSAPNAVFWQPPQHTNDPVGHLTTTQQTNPFSNSRI